MAYYFLIYIENKINGSLFLHLESDKSMVNDLGLTYGFKALLPVILKKVAILLASLI